MKEYEVELITKDIEYVLIEAESLEQAELKAKILVKEGLETPDRRIWEVSYVYEV